MAKGKKNKLRVQVNVSPADRNMYDSGELSYTLLADWDDLAPLFDLMSSMVPTLMSKMSDMTEEEIKTFWDVEDEED